MRNVEKVSVREFHNLKIAIDAGEDSTQFEVY